VRYQAAFLQSPTATALYDLNGYLVDANPAWLALFGWPDLGSLLGQPLRLVTPAGPHPSDLPDPGQTLSYRTRVAAAPGANPALAAADSGGRPNPPAETWVDLRLVAIAGSHGAVAGYQLEATDITAAVRAESELRREHARLATVISSVRVGTWERDLISGELVVNERWAGILGYRLSELSPVSVGWLAANAHAEDWALAEARLARHVNGDADQYDAEFRVRHRAGHWVWVRDRGSITQHADDGRPLWAAGTRADITARRQAQDELVETERLRAAETAVRLAVASMEAPEDLHTVLLEIDRQMRGVEVSAYDEISVQIVNADGTDFVSVNRGHAGLALPLRDTGLRWQGDGQAAARYPWVLAATQQQEPCYQPDTPPGASLPAGWSVLDVPYSHGTLAISRRRPHAFTPRDVEVMQRMGQVLSDGFWRFLDLAGRRWSERLTATNLALERVRNVVLQIESADDWLAVVQAVQRELSPLLQLRACSVCLVDTPGPPQVTFFRPWKPADQVRLVEDHAPPAVRRAVDTGEPVLRQGSAELALWDARLSDPEAGSVVDVPFGPGTLGARVAAGRQFSSDDLGLLQRFAQVLAEAHRRLEDIRRRQEAEAELAEQRLRVMQADRLQALGEMATGVAHELNQPLNGIRAFAEGMLLSHQHHWPLSEADQQETLRDIITQVDRATAIIDHMRVFARDESSATARPFQLTEPLDGALRLMGAQLRVHGIAIDRPDPGPLPPVQGWPNQLEQVIINLLTNSRDALDDRRQAIGPQPHGEADRWHPRITLALTSDRTHVRLAVTDNGGGIPDAIAHRVFEPFFTTKAIGRGTGIGLALTRALVEQHQGQIEIDNQPDHGVTFTVTLPAVPVGDAAGSA
jgi:PAS domain S-box-containing protein